MKRFGLVLSLFLFAVPAFAKLELSDIVAGYDGAEGDYQFPMKATTGYGELYIDPIQINISSNCRGHISVRTGTLTCSPNGDASKKFAFAKFARKQQGSDMDASWTVIFLDWDHSRVTLRAKANRAQERFEYTLDIRG